MKEFPSIHPDCQPGNGSRRIQKQIGTLRHAAAQLSAKYVQATDPVHRGILSGKCKRLIAAADSLEAVLALGLAGQVIEAVKARGSVTITEVAS